MKNEGHWFIMVNMNILISINFIKNKLINYNKYNFIYYKLAF